MTGFIAVFRADASPAIGGGHVRRCLSLADALAAAGWEIVFAASPQTFETMPALVRATYRHVALPPGADEARELRDRIPDGCTLLVVDHYGREAEFERYCRGWAAHILVIDDLVDRRHDCDMLVDQTQIGHRPNISGSSRPGAAFLPGPIMRFSTGASGPRASSEDRFPPLLDECSSASAGPILPAPPRWRSRR